MGLSDEGVIVVLVVSVCGLLVAHFAIVVRSAKLLTGSSDDSGTVNLVSLVAFVLLVALYTIVCTVVIFATSQDSESGMMGVALAAETVWLMSPVIAALSLLRINRSLFGSAFRIVPTSRESVKLCIKRAIVFGIPFCAVYAGGDQIIRQLLQFAITRDADYPVPISENFLNAVGNVFGYTGKSRVAQYVIGVCSNLSIGPVVDLFAPCSDSFLCLDMNGSNTGIASYLIYAIPEEIGWTGCLYPLLMGYVSGGGVLTTIGHIKAITLTGLIWGFWHTPLIILKLNPDMDNISAVLFDGLFILGCIATRFVLVSLTWPVRVGLSRMRESEDTLIEHRIVGPSIFPAIFAHAAMNVWWAFYNELFEWQDGWSLLTGSEFSLTAILWQSLIALVVVRRGLGKVGVDV